MGVGATEDFWTFGGGLIFPNDAAGVILACSRWCFLVSIGVVDGGATAAAAAAGSAVVAARVSVDTWRVAWKAVSHGNVCDGFWRLLLRD